MLDTVLSHRCRDLCRRIDDARAGAPARRLTRVDLDYVVHRREYELRLVLDDGMHWYCRLSQEEIYQQVGIGAWREDWVDQFICYFRVFYDAYFHEHYLPERPVMSHAFGLGERRAPQQQVAENNYQRHRQPLAQMQYQQAQYQQMHLAQQITAARMQQAIGIANYQLGEFYPDRSSEPTQEDSFAVIEAFERQYPASAKGWDLLMSNLTEEQKITFVASRYFEVKGQSGRRYRIVYGGSFNIRVLDPGREAYTICFLTSGRLCRGDKLLAQKLAIETREDDVLKIANR